MIAQTEIFMDAIEHLPNKGTLTIQDVSWDDYEDLLLKMEEKAGYRLIYNDGYLKIMSPRPDHEKPKELISDLIRLYTLERDIPLETYGSTTFRQQAKTKGVEPDTSFYVQNADKMIGHNNLDLDVDPPPDVVVEIDMTSESLDKFEIYAALGVPEIWRYDGNTMAFLKLASGHYEEVANSLAFPNLNSETLTRFLKQSEKDGQTKAIKAFRDFISENR